MITGLTHVAILVNDLDASIRFYCDVLGLREHFRLTSEEGKPWLVYLEIAPNQFIELFPGAEGKHVDIKTSAAVHICLQVDDIQASYKEMTARGLETNGEPILGADNSWQFWTKDPDGNSIEFHQFTPESLQLGM